MEQLRVLLTWLSKTWLSERLKASIKHEYDQKLETHKSQLALDNAKDLDSVRNELKAATNTEAEKLRPSLNMVAKEHEIKFSGLHEKRAETIAEGYSLLSDLHYKLADYVKVFESAGEPARPERQKVAAIAFDKFQDFYREKKIFFAKSIENKIDEINKDLRNAYIEFTYNVDTEPPDGERIKTWFEISKRVSEDITSTLDELRQDFREELGDTTDEDEL